MDHIAQLALHWSAIYANWTWIIFPYSVVVTSSYLCTVLHGVLKRISLENLRGIQKPNTEPPNMLVALALSTAPPNQAIYEHHTRVELHIVSVQWVRFPLLHAVYTQPHKCSAAAHKAHNHVRLSPLIYRRMILLLQWIHPQLRISHAAVIGYSCVTKPSSSIYISLSYCSVLFNRPSPSYTLLHSTQWKGTIYLDLVLAIPLIHIKQHQRAYRQFVTRGIAGMQFSTTHHLHHSHSIRNNCIKSII